MYNTYISALVAALVELILFFVFDLPPWVSLLIGITALAFTFVLLSRITTKKVRAAISAAGRDLQAQPPRIEKAVCVLQDAMPYGKWQFSVDGQLNSLIGMIYFIKRDFSGAFPYLEKAYVKNVEALGMLAVSYMKRQKKDQMISTFERALPWNRKESLLWSLYAYCLHEGGNTGKAREILARGLKKIPGDEKLKENLECLEKGRKMNMRAYGDQWFQFHLENPPPPLKHQIASMGERMQQRR